MAQHAILSPSSAHRWLACPPSAMLEQQFPDRRSESADEGTFAHSWAENELQGFIENIGEDEYAKRQKRLKTNTYYSPGLEDYVSDYVESVIRHYLDASQRDKDAALLLEQPLDCSRWVPDGFGHGDAVVIADGEMTILDLKYGQNVKVTARENPQLRLYALGAYQTFSCVYEIDRVTVVIVQPRNGGETSETLSVEELLSWGERLHRIANLAIQGKGDFKAGAHCRFCRARNRCKALADYNMELSSKYKNADAELLTDEAVAEILGRADEIVNWVNSIKAFALQEAVDNGKRWPGYKLVEGRSTRHLSDEKKAVALLTKAGFTEDQIYKPREVQGFTALEKVVGKRKLDALLKEVIIKPPGAPKLAPESDKRPEWNSAKDDFDEVTDEEVPF